MVSQDAISHDVLASSLKLSVSLSGWDFAAPNNTMRMRCSFIVTPWADSIEVSTGIINATIVPNSPLPDYTVPRTLVSISSPSSSDVMAARIVLIGFGRIDNKTNVPMGFIVSKNASSSVDRTVVQLRSRLLGDSFPNFFIDRGRLAPSPLVDISRHPCCGICGHSDVVPSRPLVAPDKARRKSICQHRQLRRDRTALVLPKP